MKELKCRNCTGSDFRFIGDGLYVCEHCGTVYTEDKLKLLITGTVDYVHGDAYLERTLQNARTFRRQKDYSKAIQAYEKLSDEYPEKEEVWYEWTACMCDYIRAEKKMPADDMFRPEYILQHAEMTETERNKGRARRMLDDAYKAYADELVNGTAAADGLYVPQMPITYDKWKQTILRNSPHFKAVIKEGEKLAERMYDKGVFIQRTADHNGKGAKYTHVFPGSDTSIYSPKFALNGMVILGSAMRDGYFEDDVTWNQVFPNSYAGEPDHGWGSIIQDCVRGWNEYDGCPYCASKNIRMTRFTGKKVCRDCGRTIPHLEK